MIMMVARARVNQIISPKCERQTTAYRGAHTGCFRRELIKDDGKCSTGK